MARFPWPKELRVLARTGIEADAVIVGFNPDVSSEGGRVDRPVVRWVDPAGHDRLASNGLSCFSADPRGRGDVLRLLAHPVEDIAFVLAEPEPAAALAQHVRDATSSANPLTSIRALTSTWKPETPPWGRKVEGTVLGVEESNGGTRVRVTFDGGKEQLLGPVLSTADPRRPGDSVDLGLNESGTIVRAPAGPAPGADLLRAEMAREPSLWRKISDNPWFP